MGVPLILLRIYKKEQFKILGLGKSNLGKSIGVRPYTKEYMKTVQNTTNSDGTLYMIKDGVVVTPFPRVLIRRLIQCLNMNT